MADVLRIKRRVSGAPGAPGSLANAELAYNEIDHVLYYGEGTGGAGGTASVIVGVGGNGLSHNINPLINGTATPGVALTWSRGDHIHPTDTTRAPLNSPAFTGVPTTATTPVSTDISTKLATTAFVSTAVGNAVAISGMVAGQIPIAATATTIGSSANLTGDITSNSVLFTVIANGAVTLGKMQSRGAAILLGNPTGLSAAPSEITLGTGLSFAGQVLNSVNSPITLSGAISGGPSATAITTTINAGVIVYSNIQNVTAARILGNPTGIVAAPSEISLGTGLSFSGTVLNAAAAPVVISGMTAGQIPIAASATTITSSGNLSGAISTSGSLVTVINSGVVTLANMQNRAAATLLGNPTGASTAPSEITLGTGLSFSGQVLNAAVAPTVISGMVAGQIPIAATANTITSSGNLSGDVTTTGSLSTTLATVNATTGTFQGITVNAKGLVTNAVNQNYAPLASPVFTGNPTGPTPANTGVGTFSLATTAFVLNTRPEQLALPLADVNFNSRKIIGLADPTNPQDGATKNYVDGAVQGISAKASVQAATVANITLSGLQTVDGIALIANDRVLVKNQTLPANNGVYVAASGAWPRSADADAWTELPSAFVFVEAGTINADSGYLCTVNPGGTIGTTPITWVQFSGAGQIVAGGGLTKTGNQLDIIGTTARILVNADSIDIDAAYVGQTSITTLGTVAAGTWNATTIAVTRGGSGATTLSGYLFGNGTSAFTASATIPNTAITGLGTMSTQNATAVAITGGTIDNITLDCGTF